MRQQLERVRDKLDEQQLRRRVRRVRAGCLCQSDAAVAAVATRTPAASTVSVVSSCGSSASPARLLQLRRRYTCTCLSVWTSASTLGWRLDGTGWTCGQVLVVGLATCFAPSVSARGPRVVRLFSSAVWLRCGALRTHCWTPSSSGAGESCGICLQLVESASCPTASAGLPDCAAVDVGGLCSSDNGECGTDVNANNCNPLGRDVYRRFDCAFHPPSPPPPPAPQTPPSPPSAPFPDCASCDAGALTSAQSPGRKNCA